MSDNTKRGLAFSVILAMVLFFLGLRIDHPRSGLKNAVGSAQSSLAIYWHHSKVSVGEKVLVNTGIAANDPQLAIVNNVSAGFIDVQTDGGFAHIPMKNVQGSLVVILPFLGKVLGVFGL